MRGTLYVRGIQTGHTGEPVVALSTGAGAPWCWRIVDSKGRTFGESAAFPSLDDALAYGQRHVERRTPDASARGSGGADAPA